MKKRFILSFQFLGIPPKGERNFAHIILCSPTRFQFLGIPPKGEREVHMSKFQIILKEEFPISRDPPEGGTSTTRRTLRVFQGFPISRDPPEGGTSQKHF